MSSQQESAAAFPLDPKPIVGDSIPLPPTARSPVHETQGSRLRVDRWIIPLVLVLAFLATSFAARNSDLWFHLASGRVLAEGKATFGADSFAYSTSQVYWTNHAWLFDLGLYWLYKLVGGPGLVILKAALAMALATILLSIHRAGSSFYLPVICTTLAIVAASRYVLVQPAGVSYLLFGLTLWLLWKQQADSSHDPARPLSAARCLLLAICALWANLDEWFFLGPLLIAIFWYDGRLTGKTRIPAWLVFAGLAACLLNPHTYHVFTLPAEFSPATWASGVRSDARYQGLFASPWPECIGAVKPLNAVDLAYLGLMVLGVLSFLLNHRAVRGWRLAVWLPSAVLAAWQARMIPFFAVVAAPVTALNVQDFLAVRAEKKKREQGDKETRRQFSFSSLLVSLSPCLLFVGLLALVGVAWLGGLSGYAREERHVGWDVQPDPSLRQAAEVLHMWRSEGLLKDSEHVFALAPEMASYTAWFSPGETQFFDHRYSLLVQVAPDYESVCRALLPELASSRSSTPLRKTQGGKDWRQVFHDNGVAVVVYHDPSTQRLFRVLNRVADDPAHWTLLHVAGHSLIVGWNEARPPGGFAALAFNADRMAFGPRNDRVQRELPATPEQGPDQLPPRRDIVDRLIGPPTPPTWESMAATMYLFHFEDSEAAQRAEQWRVAWSAYVASLTGLSALPTAVPQAVGQLYSARNVPFFRRDAATQFYTRDQLGPFLEHLWERSPAIPLLAVRTARRAVAANPRDADAWLRLGQAYLILRQSTCERSAEGLLPPLAEVRHVQIVAALEQALRLNPDLEDAHRELRFLYGQRNYLDQALDHQREELRLTRRAGRRYGETAEIFANRMEELAKDTDKLVKVVEDGRAKYVAASPSLQGERLAQTDMALKLGLGRQAVEAILLPTPAEVLGAPGIKLELEMLLLLGRVDEVRPILADKGFRASRHGLRQTTLAPPQDRDGRSLYLLPYRWPAYEWLRVLQSAAVGDYAQAREDLQAIRADLGAGREQLQRQVRSFDTRIWLFVPGFMSGPSPILPTLTALDLRRTLNEKQVLEISESALRAQQADLCVLEGLLALEQGNTDAARTVFAEAQELGSQVSAVPVPSAGAPITAFYLGKLQGQE